MQIRKRTVDIGIDGVFEIQRSDILVYANITIKDDTSTKKEKLLPSIRPGIADSLGDSWQFHTTYTLNRS